MRTVLVIVSVALCLAAGAAKGRAQDIGSIKAKVVRIENSNPKIQEVGAGFIVKIKGDDVYIVTAAHVVRSDSAPKVYFSSDPLKSVLSELVYCERDDVKGLALIKVAVKNAASKLTAFRLVSTTGFGDAPTVRIIGFPGTSMWTVDQRNLVRVEGRDLVLSPSVRPGYSGGPVVYGEGTIGLITDVSDADAYATPAKDIVSFVNGLFVNLSIEPLELAPSPFSRNLILNGGFEEKLKFWGTGYIEDHFAERGDPPTPPFWTAGGATAQGELDETEHHSGKRSFKITNTIVKEPIHFANLSQKLKNLKPETEYEVSLWLKARNAKAGALVLIFDQENEDRHEMPVGTYDWKPVTLKFKTATDPAADFRLSTENAGEIWIDDIQVFAVEPTEPTGGGTAAAQPALPIVVVVESENNKASMGQILWALQNLKTERRIHLDAHPATTDSVANDIVGEKKPALIIVHVHALVTEKATVNLIREINQLSPETQFLVFSETFAVPGTGRLWVRGLWEQYGMRYGRVIKNSFVEKIQTIGFKHSDRLEPEQKIEMRKQVSSMLELK